MKYFFFHILILLIGATLYLTTAPTTSSAPQNGTACQLNNQCNSGNCFRNVCRPVGFCNEDAQCVNRHGPAYFCNANNVCKVRPTPTPLPPPPPPPSECKPNNIDIMLVIDTSRSMSVDGAMNKAKSAAKTFKNIALNDPRVRIGIASFDRNGRVDRDFTRSNDAITTSIDRLQYAEQGFSGTCLECVLDKEAGVNHNDVFNAIRRLSPQTNHQVIVILSDGQINWYYDDNAGRPINDNERAKAQALRALRAIDNTYGVDVWVAGYDVKGTAARQYLQELAQGTVGRFVGSETKDGLTPIYRSFANQIIAGGEKISGYVFHDINENGIQDGTERFLVNERITLAEDRSFTNSQFTVTDTNGYYDFIGLCNGSKFLKALPDENWKIVSPVSGMQSVSISYNDSIVDYANTDFGLAPISNITGSISGAVFVDTDMDGLRGSAEALYTGALNFLGNLGNPAIVNGTYSYADLPIGLYTVILEPPQGFSITSPPNNTYNVQLNPNGTCITTPFNSQTDCTNSNLTNLNFGITDSQPWFQTIDFSVRNDLEGIKNSVPSAATSQCQAVTIRNGSSGNPGVVYSGDSSTDFGKGTASSRNWIVQGADSVYSGSTSLSTSYASTLLTLKRNNVDIKPLTCTPGNCTLTNTLQSNPYIVDGDLTINSVNFTSAKALIFVEGDLRIRGNIIVNPGAFLMFVVKGSIYVEPTVGAATNSCPGSGTATQIQSILSSDTNVYLEGGAPCPAGDRQLNLAGSIITNANKISGGKLINNRNLCSANRQYPSFTIQPRLDFLLSAPEFMLRSQANWQEVAP